MPGEQNILPTDPAVVNLLKRLAAGDKLFSPEEEQQLLAWKKSSATKSWMTDTITDPAKKEELLRLFGDIESNKNNNWKILAQKLQHNLPQEENQNDTVHQLKPRYQNTRIIFRWASAAAIIICAAIGAYLWTTGKKTDHAILNNYTDVPPGGEKAVLTLADGTQIILDSAANGNLAQQGSTDIIKQTNGRIVYNVSSSAIASKTPIWNTMSTPVGGQYQIILPDGTKVWLNAASSITYPTAFIENHRSVKIKGEAYFEVSGNKLKPFIVDIDGKSIVEVLGTSFNISSYENEGNIKTTLLKGGVKITNANKSTILKPGQQATIDAEAISIKPDADIDQVLAWKNGLFNLDGADLQSVMRQLERWYDIRVEYRGPIDKAPFKGKIDRNLNLSNVLERLKEIGVRFELKGKKLIVL